MREEETYKYIKEYFAKNKLPPTIRQIGNALHLSSTSTVWSRLNKLEHEGKIKRTGKSYIVCSAKITFDDDE